LITDKFCFNLDFADGCACVWRGQIERFYPENAIQRDRYGGGSVMIWGKIDRNGKTNLVKVNRTPNPYPYCDANCGS
jgi:hypothetical protein